MVWVGAGVFTSVDVADADGVDFDIVFVVVGVKDLRPPMPSNA